MKTTKSGRKLNKIIKESLKNDKTGENKLTIPVLRKLIDQLEKQT